MNKDQWNVILEPAAIAIIEVLKSDVKDIHDIVEVDEKLSDYWMQLHGWKSEFYKAEAGKWLIHMVKGMLKAERDGRTKGILITD